MIRAITPTIAIVMAITLTMASPAGAAGPYDVIEESPSGFAGSNNAAWTASADMTSTGQFDNAASVDDPGVTFDAHMASALGFSRAGSAFWLEPGEYVATVAFSDVTISLASSGFAGARADVGVEFSWSGEGDLEFSEHGGDSLFRSSFGGVAQQQAPPVSHASTTVWDRFRVTTGIWIIVSSTADTQVHSGPSVPDVHGGTASGHITGQVDSITVAPA